MLPFRNPARKKGNGDRAFFRISLERAKDEACASNVLDKNCIFRRVRRSVVVAFAVVFSGVGAFFHFLSAPSAQRLASETHEKYLISKET